MPAGYLGYLALTACDDGAIGDFSVETDPNDPTMVRIDTMMQQTALSLMGWTGFEAFDQGGYQPTNRKPPYIIN
jgi:hypothetical protein